MKGNRIETNGNECVDIKEGATGNLIEENICSNQLDDNGGCYSSQSDRNIFRCETTDSFRARSGLDRFHSLAHGGDEAEPLCRTALVVGRALRRPSTRRGERWSTAGSATTVVAALDSNDNKRR